LVVAFDHGLFDGPVAGMESPDAIPAKILADTDAALLSFGMFNHLKPELFAQRVAPMPIVRINWSSIYCFSWNYHSGDTVATFTPKQIVEQGGQAVLISLSLCTGSEKRDTENVQCFADLCRQAHDLGMMVIGEYFPVNDEALSPQQMHDEVKIGCRVLFELGADVIKTFHTHRFDDVVTGCPAPILTLGGRRAPSDLAALEMAAEQIQSGAAGLVFGRNVLQSPKPIQLQQALLDVIKRDVSAKDAAKKHNLI
jgi:DhnA family fructose-bisphosphate aldolase class Ia